MTCARLDVKSYNNLGSSPEHWYCFSCICSLYPFMLLDNADFIETFLCDSFPNAVAASLLLHDLNCKFLPNRAIFDRINGDLTADVSSTCVYHDPADLILRSLLVGISCMHVNIRSISSNLDCFVDMLNIIQCQLDFIMFSETWVNVDCVNLFNMVGYKHVSVPRVGKKGAGVAIYAKNC
jgi:hypothetical protein